MRNTLEDVHDDDCGCAVCATLVMESDGDWKPVLVHGTETGTCCFCRMYKPVHHYTRFGTPVCYDCNPS